MNDNNESERMKESVISPATIGDNLLANNSLFFINPDIEEHQWQNQEMVEGNGSLENPYLIKNRLLDGDEEKNGIVILNSDDYVIIEDCIFRDCVLPIGGSALWLVNSSKITIIDCEFKYSTSGIRVGNSFDINVVNNRFLENFYGLYILNSRGLNISINEIDLCENGIWCEDSVSVIITHNIIEQSTQNGLSALNSYYVNIEFNTLNLNTFGLVANDLIQSDINWNECSMNEMCGITLGASQNCNLLNNTCVQNGECGISLGTSTSLLLEYNFCAENQIGVNFYSCKGFNLNNNSFIENGIGIRLKSCENYNLEGNVFIRNETNLDLVKSFSWMSLLYAVLIAIIIIISTLYVRNRSKYSRKMEKNLAKSFDYV